MWALVKDLLRLTLQHAHSMRPREMAGVLWAAASLNYRLQPWVLDKVMQVCISVCQGPQCAP